MEKGKRVTSKIGVFVISGQDQGIDNRSKRMGGARCRRALSGILRNFGVCMLLNVIISNPVDFS